MKGVLYIAVQVFILFGKRNRIEICMLEVEWKNEEQDWKAKLLS